MRDHIELAIKNIVNYGDTDIFPFCFENHVFFDNNSDTIDLLLEYHKNFQTYLNRYPPRHISALAPVGYNGFRWATQLDPIWNAYFLACVLAIAEEIEKARIAKDQDIVFSYRFESDHVTGELFKRCYSWSKFVRRSLELCESYQYVVVCDISDFYPRIGHHRLENALKHVDKQGDISKRIIDFLKNFTNSRSYGLPIGGPAARILSELVLNQIDWLLNNRGIKFTRYADDYHLFSNNRNHAYQNLIFLSEKLFINQGLSLQKSKTRIITAAEFKATSSIREEEDNSDNDCIVSNVGDVVSPKLLFRFSLAFDPYSPTAREDYENLKEELNRFDILGLLRSELQKSKIHAALTRKIVQAVRHLDENVRDEAIRTILDNSEILYPIYSSVLILLNQVFDDLSESTQIYVLERIRELISNDSVIMRVDIHLAFAIRILSHKQDESSQGLLEQLYENRRSPLIRRDIILVIARWKGWYWLSDLRNRFRELSGPEKRAFIVASYELKDEGKHWRRNNKNEFTPFEELVRIWVSKKSQDQKWKIPL